MTWRDATRKKLARRALERELAYQERKAEHLRGHEDEVILAMKTSSRRVRDLLEGFQPIAPDARVVEVGSGAHGLIFYFGSSKGIGIDPLAVAIDSCFRAGRVTSRPSPQLAKPCRFPTRVSMS